MCSVIALAWSQQTVLGCCTCALTLCKKEQSLFLCGWSSLALPEHCQKFGSPGFGQNCWCPPAYWSTLAATGEYRNLKEQTTSILK